MIKYAAYLICGLSIQFILAPPVVAQESIEQNLEMGNLSDGILGNTQDFKDGDIENLDILNGYPHPDRAEALEPPHRLYQNNHAPNKRK
jgi:hypothetical protein